MQDFAAARLNMVENQVRTSDVTDLAVQDAMRVVERERFCPPERRFLAYAETAVEYAPGWSIMQPRDISKLLQAVSPKAGERALAICAPYAAAVLAEIGLKVILRLPEEAQSGLDAAFREHGARPVLMPGDPREVGEGAPFDVIVCEAGVAETPAVWLDAVKEGGRLGVVERRGPVGKAVLYSRGADGRIARRELFDATPPVSALFTPVPVFNF